MMVGEYMNLEKKKKIALITGASRGIGLAIAKEFAAAGYHLILTCNNSFDILKEEASSISKTYHVDCLPLQANMGEYGDVESVFQQIDDLDVLVNNAGISYVGLLSDMAVDDWHNIMHVNLDSCFYTCKHAIPLFLKKQAGRIINISSVWGNVGASMEVAYSATKGGINSFTKALAKELGPSNIPVNAIACGIINTAMNACFSEEDLDAIKEEIPCDRIGEPEEVAKLALQLAQAPTYLTGQIITIDGGWC